MHKTISRANVTVDDRRVVLVAAKGRKPAEVAKVPHEQFIRNTLKDRLGWPRREPAPEALKVAARELAAVLVARDKAVQEAAKAAIAAHEAEEDKLSAVEAMIQLV